MVIVPEGLGGGLCEKHNQYTEFIVIWIAFLQLYTLTGKKQSPPYIYQ